ncbi:MAG: hypothetical protein U5K43_12850 [Halofilum sp. (in: g-proteobacteria)]|nr:hypothetical protein [Halofilum sp. (in: g-proteobacteria)]
MTEPGPISLACLEARPAEAARVLAALDPAAAAAFLAAVPARLGAGAVAAMSPWQRGPLPGRARPGTGRGAGRGACRGRSAPGACVPRTRSARAAVLATPAGAGAARSRAAPAALPGGPDRRLDGGRRDRARARQRRGDALTRELAARADGAIARRSTWSTPTGAPVGAGAGGRAAAARRRSSRSSACMRRDPAPLAADAPLSRIGRRRRHGASCPSGPVVDARGRLLGALALSASGRGPLRGRRSVARRRPGRRRRSTASLGRGRGRAGTHGSRGSLGRCRRWTRVSR